MWKESLQHQRESLGDRVSEARGMKRLAQKLVIGLLMLRKEGLEKLQLRWNSGSFEENCELIFSKFCMKPPLELMIFFSFFLGKGEGEGDELSGLASQFTLKEITLWQTSVWGVGVCFLFFLLILLLIFGVVDWRV